MTRARTVAVVGTAALVVAAAIWGLRRHPLRDTQPLRTGALRGANVLLVTIDTLRADRVGAYGSTAGLTPTIDSFARGGLRFERAYSHVPLTLPSHATIMTASYPTRSGVRDNGAFRLGPAFPTLAESIRRAGYRTGAFVSSFVLDARFGLARGFDEYDDRMLGRGGDVEVVQRNAGQVLGPAYDWIAGERSTRWFAWVHLYDPHEPYTPPEPYRSRYNQQPYDGEIAYADAAFGQFVGRLRQSGALAHTLVVIASDHGESLGEHGERTHGLFAYNATLSVPLVMWADGVIRPGVFAEPARLVDVAPTILDLIGGAPLAGVDGSTLRPFVSGERAFVDPGSYFEALNANLTRNWAPLTGLIRQGTKLIDLPIPELYDVTADPDEQHNVYAAQRERARDLEARLDAVAKGAAPLAPTAIDQDARNRLRSLGYVVGASPQAGRHYTAADDPKQLVHLNLALDDAAAAWARGDAESAVTTLDGIIRERPDFAIAYERLGYILRAIGHPDRAVGVLDAAARKGYGGAALLRSLGAALRDAGNPAGSAKVLEDLSRADPTDLETADELGVTLTRLGRSRDAERTFRRVLDASPNSAETWNNLGSLFLSDRRYRDAAAALSRAVEIDPDLAAAHNGLGVAYAAQGDTGRAATEWTRALALRPDYADAKYNLERLQK